MTSTPMNRYDTQTSDPGFLAIQDGDQVHTLELEGDELVVDVDGCGRILGIERFGGLVDHDTLVRVLRAVRVVVS